MGHAISAIVLKGLFSEERAAELSLRPIDLGFELTMFPLCAELLDQLAAEQGIDRTGIDLDEGSVSAPLLDGPVIAHLVHYLTPNPMYAVIETEYFGGVGDQAAVVYDSRRVVLEASRAEYGPINRALSALGVVRRRGQDEFDTVSLGRYRHLDDFLAGFWR